MSESLRIRSEDSGQRIDVLLSRTFPQYSRAFLQKALKRGFVRLAGQTVPTAHRVKPGEVFDIARFVAKDESPSAPTLRPALTAPKILFEDDALMAINKPAGVVVHPAPGHQGPTLIDWVKWHWGKSVVKIFTDPERLGLVHRLDKDTSGVLIMAKTVESQTAISRQFHDRTVRKTYRALVEGVPSAKSGTISAPVARSRKNPSRMAVSGEGRPSETVFTIRTVFGNQAAELELQPRTGRTHQIRVHCAALGHPIIGDLTYGSHTGWQEKYNIRRPMLHAYRLEVDHPVTGRRQRFEAPVPADFKQARQRLKQVFVTALAGLLLSVGGPVRANDETAAHRPRPSATAKQMRRMEKTVDALNAQLDKLSAKVDDLQQQVNDLEKGMQAVGNFSQRLSDVEHALAEINSKAVHANATAEDARTQYLDTIQRLKTQQSAIESLRDQVDRLQSQVAAAAPK